MHSVKILHCVLEYLIFRCETVELGQIIISTNVMIQQVLHFRKLLFARFVFKEKFCDYPWVLCRAFRNQLYPGEDAVEMRCGPHRAFLVDLEVGEQ